MKSFVEPVLETLEHSGLDLEQAILYGGGVLALEGLRRAHDVDLFIPDEIFADIKEAGQLPNGQPVELFPVLLGANHNPRLITFNRVVRRGLAIDLIVPYDFEEEMNGSRAVTIGNLTIHHATLADVRRAKLSHNTPRLKDRMDIRRINRKLDGGRGGT